MRLTLRTMLAYLDDILEPNDAQDLEHKIDESKFASDLVHRIRTSTRRLRLGAPKVDGKGMADDANTVAEYLDNTMSAERVLEFEKVCLESDVHLGEVASAHQILTHVLREPAVIDPAIRDRVYQIGQPEVASSPPGVPENGKAAGPAIREEMSGEPPRVAAAMAARSTPMVEEPAALARAPSVIASSSKTPVPLKSLAVTLLLGFVLAAVALRAMGEFNRHHPVLRLLVGTGEEPQAAQVPVQQPSTSGESTSEQGRPADLPAGGPTKNKTNVKPTGKSDRVDVDDGVKGDDGLSPSATVPPSIPAKTIVPDPAIRPADAVPAAIPAPADVLSKSVPPSEPADATKATTTTGKVADSATVTVAPAKPAKPPTGGLTKPTESSTTAPGEQPPAPTISAGLFLSEEQVIGRLDKSTGAWVVLPVNSPLAAGEEFLSLPAYRPQVLVAPNVKLTLSGESFLKLHVPDATNIPRVTLNSGQATLVPVGEMGGSIRIDVGGRSGLLSFADVESAAALEVRLYLPPGTDPLSVAPHVVVQLWATSGAIDWQEPDRAAVKLTAGQMAWFLDESEMTVVDTGALPDWIDGKNLRDIDRRASQELRKFLTSDRPLSLSLMEQTNYRQVEVRSLACRALCYLDIYEPALESLGDEQQRSYWHMNFDALRMRLAQGSEPAGKVRAAVDQLFNEQAGTVFRLMVGFSPEQLAGGGASELVEDLSDATMTIRVLAYENLRRITGKTFLYRPEERPDQEKSKVAKWRKLLDDGQITYTTVPSPLPAPTPAPAAKRAPPASVK